MRLEGRTGMTDPGDHGSPPDHEPVTRGGPDLPPPASVTGRDGEPAGAAGSPEPNGLFVGPADAPDRYELLGHGMSGGEGTTWKARYRGDLAAPLPLAIKLLDPPRDAGPERPSARDRRRWQDQAVLLRHLDLEHLVRLDEVFLGAPPHLRGTARPDAGTMAYLVMEWVEGPTLQALLGGVRATRATIRERLEHVAHVCEALASLASMTRSGGNPSLHRDVKPTNCIVHAVRGVVLIDVSTLRLIDDGHDSAGRHTPAYTSPEVLAAPHLPRSVAADVYSLGALAFFCLTGQDPPAADTPGAAGYIAGELRAVAEEAGVGDPGRLTSHLLTTLDAQAARRPKDLRNWARDLREAASPGSDRAAAGAGEAAGAAGGHGGRPRHPRRRTTRPALSALAVIVAASVVVLPRLIAAPDGSDTREGRQPPTASSATAGVTPPGAASPAGDATTATGTITSPVDGADVKACAYFSGTSSLPPETTLLLVVQNVDNGDLARYVQVVFDYDRPAALPAWRGAQYFGGKRHGIDQDYQVDLIAVDLEAARRDHESGAATNDALVSSGELLASVRVHRIAGTVPNACVGPPGG
ncbi:protein kinase [Streptosporangium sp. NPDC023615]|uniref:serine/threonine protein kinase n=1 Tax=Streptosporangium sp. NPDC023615 TaxID=3154794 RepID=UPI003419423E